MSGKKDICRHENEHQEEANVIDEVKSDCNHNHKQCIVMVGMSIDKSKLKDIDSDGGPNNSEVSTKEINMDRGFQWRKEVTTFKGRLAAVIVLITLVTPIAILLLGCMNSNSKNHTTVRGSEEFYGADEFKNDLILKNVSTKIDLEDSTSPQSKAFFWISERNIFQTDNYILATIAFGLDGEIGMISTLLEDDKDLCQWRWVGCIEGRKISKIDINDENLNGVLVKEIMHLTELRFLSISNHEIGGAIPSEVGTLSMLETLRLRGNNFSGSIPDSIWGLTDLKVLDLRGNRELKGTIPKRISSMTALETLDMTDCSMYGSIPSEIGTLQNLQEFRLGSNPNLNGTIPVEVGELKSLKDFDIGNCMGISGTIPTEFGDMESLENANLSFNFISGTIPSEVGAMANLQSFTTMSNPLEGTIPVELGNLHNLEFLNVKSSSLIGSIPSEFGMLSNLEIFEVSGNFLTGTIPIELGKVRKLNEVNLCDNYITGPVPNKWCMDKNIFVRYDCECCKRC